MSSQIERSNYRINYSHALVVLFISFFTIPQFIFVWFDQSSIGGGLFLVTLGMFALYLIQGRLCLTRVQIGALVLAGVSICLYRPGDLPRQILSWLVIAFIFLSTNNFFKDLTTRSDRDIRRVVKITFYSMMVIGVGGKFALFKTGPYATDIRVFPFFEPSHLALTLGPIACAYLFQLRLTGRLMVVSSVLGLGLWYPNLTLLAIAGLLLVLALRGWFLLTSAVFLAGSVFLAGFGNLEKYPQYNYVAARLGRGNDGENLTYLGYVQGWQQVAIAIHETHGLGIGFQRFGRESAGEAAQKIVETFGHPVSRMDGSNLGVKIAGEFGFVGIGICVWMIWNSAKGYCRLRRLQARGFEGLQYVDAFFYSCTYMFFIEIVFRGLAYFNPTFFLYIYGVSRLSGRGHIGARSDREVSAGSTNSGNSNSVG